MEYRRAVRENTNVLVALAGASGSGKTYSAMLLATGICGDEPFAMVDTEARRGLHYADQFNFEHTSLGPPFTPMRYLEAVREVAKRGFQAVVIDSGSHEWEGEGGVIEWADAEEAAGKKSIGIWIKPKAAHKKFVNGLLQCGTNLIICLRAQEKTKAEKRGRETIITNEGWSPICEKRFMYEMTTSFTLNPLTPGVIDLTLPNKVQDQHRMMFLTGQHITAEAGAALGAWARGEPIDVPDKALWDKARREAHQGRKALRDLTVTLSDADKLKLEPIRVELNRTARVSDRNRTGDGEPEAEPDNGASPDQSEIKW